MPSIEYVIDHPHFVGKKLDTKTPCQGHRKVIKNFYQTCSLIVLSIKVKVVV